MRKCGGINWVEDLPQRKEIICFQFIALKSDCKQFDMKPFLFLIFSVLLVIYQLGAPARQKAF